MFVRTKKIKGKPYAYLVENHWTKNGARQKVLGYLGGIEVCSRISQLQFNAKHLTFSQIVEGLVLCELKSHGFMESGKRWRRGEIEWNPSLHTLRRNGVKVCLKINEGYLAEMTIQRLLGFTSKGKPENVALKLADSFVLAGIGIPKDVFVEAYQRLGKRFQF